MTTIGYHNIHEGISEIQLTVEPRRIGHRTRRAIEVEWGRLRSYNPNLWTSRMLGLHPKQTRLEEGVLQISGYLTSYKEYKCSKNIPGLETWSTGSSGLARVTGPEPYLLFAQRKASTAKIGGNLEQIPAGFMDPKDLEAQDPYLATILRELEEETGVSKDKVLQAQLLRDGRIKKDPDHGTEYHDHTTIYLLDLKPISPHDLTQIFDANPQKEHHSLICVPENQLEQFYKDRAAEMGVRTRWMLEDHLARP